MTASPNVRQSVAIADPGNPANAVKPNSDGSINVVPAISVKAASATVSVVASGTSSVTLLAANSDRVGVTITNTDSNALYVLCGSGTVTNTNFSLYVAQNVTATVPFGYTGQINGLWAADGTGSAIVSEFE